MTTKTTGLTHLIRSTQYSLKGLKAAIRYETAFRHELSLSAVLVPIAIWLAPNIWQFLALVAPLFLLLIVELLNSAVEAVVDRIGLERHELSGRAKDLGSAAVFVTLCLLVLIWGVVAWQRFM